MARLLGILFLGAAFALVLGTAAGQDSEKKKGDLEGFFKKLDTNGDGKIQKDEFLQLAERSKDKEKARERLTRAYEKVDPDNKGLTRDDLKKLFEMRKKKKDQN